jgi:hypothetical protein
VRKVKNWIKTYVQCLFKEFCHLSFEHSSDLAAAISGGKLFQSLTVLTKKRRRRRRRKDSFQDINYVNQTLVT